MFDEPPHSRGVLAMEVRDLCQSDVEGLDAQPICVSVVSYAPPCPRNIWANTEFLQMSGITLAEFKTQDYSRTLSADLEKTQLEDRFQTVQIRKQTILERSVVPAKGGAGRMSVETSCTPIRWRTEFGELIDGVLVVHWPVDVRSQLEANTTYMTALLECSPYPLCFFTFDGHLITCNPAARVVFGKTIWLQSDIFGMGERERRGLNAANPTHPGPSGSFKIEKTERRTAYEDMMDALQAVGSTFEVDIPIKRDMGGGSSMVWYCRVFAQRQKDPVTGEPIIMVSHQDVTNLRKVEGELGRMLMSEHTSRELKKHDSDVAGSLLVLLGEGWQYQEQHKSLDTQAEEEGEGAEARGGMSIVQEFMQGQSPDTPPTGAKANQLEGLRAVLEKADHWEFDVFELEAEAGGLPLQVLSWHVFVKHGLIEEFNLDHVRLVNFLRVVENGHQDNPYHNATHVADVVQSMHLLIKEGGITQYVGRLEVLAALLAACVHDFEHRGLNNDFLIKSSDDWAIDSNDKSPNESHHLSASYRIIQANECNFLHRMPHAQQAALRKLVIDLVLATDMAEHMAIVSKLKTDLHKRIQSPEDNIQAGGEVPDALKTLILQAAIKIADIGHLYASHDVHIKWSERLEEEMWRQGDVEKQRSMKVSFLMDRDKPGVTKSQPGFVDFVVRPLFETWVACFPKCQTLMDRVEANYHYWKLKEQEQIAEGAPAETP
uniref:Phosphodiesterase n=3 Tax=Hemiselmis andersenii TaxID=464988 RepID=A0A6T8JUN8_HEMAN|mmetsp:Transcript_21967/g.50297  ORF Transcript_21967/g.50297 Transcript_21967/m.50297 type:complete len:716 (+) Transcript_21967:134-2281(+)